MAYDADPSTRAWFEAAMSSEHVRIRWRAVELLHEVDGPLRSRWLARAANDPDPRVAATAVLVAAGIEARDLPGEDLLESDFAEGTPLSPLGWEWEYGVFVCRGLCVPSSSVLVWTREEADAEAKRLAVLKACAGELHSGTIVPIIASKRFVNRFTRSARTTTEAVRWHRLGRPRFQDHD